MKDAEEFIQTKQTSWALRKGLTLRNRSTRLGIEKHYTAALDDNLFIPLAATARTSFEVADGNELKAKMLALGSSSALAVNLFAYWNEIEKVSVMGELLGLPSPEELSKIQFESIHPIIPGSRTSPNLDAEFVYETPGKQKRVFVECKFLEPYRDDTKAIKLKYFECGAFDGLPNLRAAAENTLVRETRSKRFNASQAVTHILGLNRSCGGPSRFTLLYLWYDAPGQQAALHAEEMKNFAATVARDGVDFRAVPQNQLFVRIAKLRSHYPEYVDYIGGRYL